MAGMVTVAPFNAGSSLRTTWRQLLPFSAGGARPFAVLAGSSAVGGMLEAAVLVVVTKLAVGLAAKGDRLTVPVLGHTTRGTLIAIALGLLAVKLVFQLLAAYQAASLATRSLTSARLLLLDEFLGASWAEQSSQRLGVLQELMTTHVDRVASILLQAAQGLVALTNVIALLVVAVVVSPLAAVGIVVTGLVLSAVMRPLTAAIRRHSHLHVITGKQYAASVTETVAMAREVRVLNAQPAVVARMGELHQISAAPYQRSRFLVTFAPNLYQSLAISAVLGALALVGDAGSGGVAAVGAVVLLLLRALSFSQQAQSAHNQVSELAPYLADLGVQLERYHEAQVETGGAELDHVGAIAFEHVRFRYDPDRPALDDLSFIVDAGESIGIVGPSGSGKSTIVQLLLRLRKPTEGRITVHGESVDRFSLPSWYRRVAYVPQEPHLLAGTVAENIDFFRGHSRAEVEQAAARAHVDAEVRELPLGFDTVIGEGGGGLSGGQRQRICIARALLGDPEVIVLDEPTSALDLRSEAKITETLQELHGRTTMVIVAHRISTLSHCDRILVVTGGRVQGFAPHDELLATSPFYIEAIRLASVRP